MTARLASGANMAAGSEPNPPALDTAAANALPWTPAMGAWMMGNPEQRLQRHHGFSEAPEGA